MKDGVAAAVHAERNTSGVRRTVHGSRTGLELHAALVTGSGMAHDFLRGAPALAPFYAGHPLDPATYRRKAAAVRARLPAAARAAVAEALTPTTAAAATRLEHVLAGDGFFVTTGQQTGLFGGPPYTAYKLLTATRLAAALEELLGEPCVAVFWMASDDHDWAEANHTSVVDAEGAPLRITLDAPPEAPPVPMSAHRLGDAIHTALAALERVVPESPFSGALLERVRQAYRPDETMGSAFGSLMLGLLRDVDAVLLDPSSPALKRAASPILRRELEQSGAHARLLGDRARQLESAGYPAQVTIADDAANVFFHDPLGRDRLVRDGEAWQLRRTRRAFADAELFSLLDHDPTRFSPNVLLRPVVEGALLPTLAYVGGPAEIAYFAQIGCLFRAHGMEATPVFPRCGVTIVEPPVRRILDKFGLSIDDVRRPFHELVTHVLRDELPASVSEPLARLRAALSAEYDRLSAAARDIDPTLEGWVQRNRNEALARVRTSEKKILSHLRRRSKVEMAQLRRIAAHLQPDGEPQERALNLLPLLGRFGDGLLLDIADAMEFALDQPAPAWQGVECSSRDTSSALPSNARGE